MTIETSIIIRTKNEARYLQRVLDALKSQTYRQYEIIIVDDNSTDKTVSIAEQNNCRVVSIPKGKFSHPYSCNLGAKEAVGEYIVFLNGHSIPISKTWLADGLRNFSDKMVAGIYARALAQKDGTIADKLLLNVTGYTLGSFKFKARRNSSGLLGTTNAIIRRDLWLKTQFSNSINGGWGGEDTDWANKHMDMGYKIIHEPKFRVRHSHHLGIKDFFWQLKNWSRMGSVVGKKPEKQRRYY
jgi:glycosyltransferase involved in cell wall biosynthesis